MDWTKKKNHNKKIFIKKKNTMNMNFNLIECEKIKLAKPTIHS